MRYLRHCRDHANAKIRPHDGWLDISKPFIAAYKAGATSVDSYINDEELVYWYRPAPRDVNCDATDTCMVGANNSSGNYFMGRPNGWESMADAVFVVAMLKSPGTVTVNSGGKVQTFEAPAGASAFQAPMGVGSQWFALSRGGQTVLSGTSLLPIIDGCVCGLYNFNPYGRYCPVRRWERVFPAKLHHSRQPACPASRRPAAGRSRGFHFRPQGHHLSGDAIPGQVHTDTAPISKYHIRRHRTTDDDLEVFHHHHPTANYHLSTYNHRQNHYDHLPKLHNNHYRQPARDRLYRWHRAGQLPRPV